MISGTEILDIVLKIKQEQEQEKMKDKVITISSSPIDSKILRRPSIPLQCRAPLRESSS